MEKLNRKRKTHQRRNLKELSGVKKVSKKTKDGLYLKYYENRINPLLEFSEKDFVVSEFNVGSFPTLQSIKLYLSEIFYKLNVSLIAEYKDMEMKIITKELKEKYSLITALGEIVNKTFIGIDELKNKSEMDLMILKTNKLKDYLDKVYKLKKKQK